MKKRLSLVLCAIAMIVGLIVISVQYYRLVSNAIYTESIAHLTEIYHQVNQNLYNLVGRNWDHLHTCEPYILESDDDEKTKSFITDVKEKLSFTDFYFISREGNYLTLSGETGYLDMKDRLASLILDGEDVAVTSVVPGKPQIIIFAIPTGSGIYRDFHYEAIAISFNNSDLVDALKISTFDGQSGSFVVRGDGRVIVNNTNDTSKSIYNFVAMLKDNSDLTKEKIAVLQEDFANGNSGATTFRAGGVAYYLVYESANFEDWMVLGVVPAGVVNASMNKLQSTTAIVVSGIVIALAMTILLMVVQQSRQKLKRKDNELLAHDELFSKLSINVDDVFLMVDAKSLRVEYVSPNIEKLVGISEQQVLSDIHVIEHLIRADESTDLSDQFSKIFPGEQREWDRECIHQKTGEELWFRVVVFCTDIQGEKKYILDLSDRTKDRRINQKLEDAVHTAENASRAKTIFLNNMSHDIRTPMNAIIGFTNIALKQETKPEVRNCLNKISNSSEHLLTLINDVLDISRIESGNVKFAPVPIDITAVADTVLSIMQGFLSDRNITFRTILETPEKPYVLVDVVRIREVLVNILGNAVKFTEDGGSITFEASYHPGVDDRHMMVRYRVTDTGVGMSEEFVEHIFDEFSQEGNGARTQYKGTGLGMAITKRYVDLMDGTISVQSKKGEGSTFTVELPMELTDESNIQKQDVPDAKADLMDIKVLLAEDNDLNAEIATVQLEELGVQVTRVANGKEAVKIFAENPPDTFDIIFMDIMMPEMNGYEATETIRSMQDRPDARSIPIIAMTANAFAEDVQESLNVGMNGHIAKPIVIEEVVNAIAGNLKR